MEYIVVVLAAIVLCFDTILIMFSIKLQDLIIGADSVRRLRTTTIVATTISFPQSTKSLLCMQ